MTAPVFLLFFALEYTGRVEKVTGAQIAQLLVLPVAATLAVLTNSSHHLVWAQSELLHGLAEGRGNALSITAVQGEGSRFDVTLPLLPPD